MMQGQPDAGQLMQQLIQIREQHPDAYPAALQHTLELYGGDVKQFIAALQNEQGGQQPQQAQEQPPATQAAPQPPVQQQPPQQKAPPPAPPIKAPAPPTTGFGMSQGPRFLNGPTTADKTAAGLMAGMPVHQAQGNAMAAKPHMAAGGQVTPPLGSTPEEVADDIPAQLSQDETVIPANVSKWFGQRTFEQMNQEAEQGFAKMAQEGRLKDGGGNAAGGMQDLTNVAASEQLMEDNKKKLLDSPDDDIGHPTGFMAGGQVLPNASPVDGFADGGFVQDPQAVFVGPDGNNQSENPANSEGVTNNGTQTDRNTWGNTWGDKLADRALGFAAGMAGPAGMAANTAFSTARDVINANRAVEQANQNGWNIAEPTTMEKVGQLAANAPGISTLRDVANWLGMGLTTSLEDKTQLAKDETAFGKALDNPDNPNNNPDEQNSRAEDNNTARPDEGFSKTTFNPDGTVTSGPDTPSTDTPDNTDNGDRESGREGFGGGTTGGTADGGDRESGREGFGGNGHESNDNSGHEGTESAGGDGGSSDSAAIGGFFAKAQPKLKKINKETVRKSEDKAPKFMVGGFVEPRASVRKITNRGIKVPKIL